MFRLFFTKEPVEQPSKGNKLIPILADTHNWLLLILIGDLNVSISFYARAAGFLYIGNITTYFVS